MTVHEMGTPTNRLVLMKLGVGAVFTRQQLADAYACEFEMDPDEASACARVTVACGLDNGYIKRLGRKGTHDQPYVLQRLPGNGARRSRKWARGEYVR